MNIEQRAAVDDGQAGENYMLDPRGSEFNALLTSWAGQGWIRALDRAFAFF